MAAKSRTEAQDLKKATSEILFFSFFFREILTIFQVAKGRFTRCDLSHTILLHCYAETKAIINDPVNLKGVVYNLWHPVNQPNNVYYWIKSFVKFEKYPF